jgi:hypothetical protein
LYCLALSYLGLAWLGLVWLGLARLGVSWLGLTWHVVGDSMPKVSAAFGLSRPRRIVFLGSLSSRLLELWMVPLGLRLRRPYVIALDWARWRLLLAL